MCYLKDKESFEYLRNNDNLPKYHKDFPFHAQKTRKFGITPKMPSGKTLNSYQVIIKYE